MAPQVSVVIGDSCVISAACDYAISCGVCVWSVQWMMGM